MRPEFQTFGISHLVALVLTFGLPILASWMAAGNREGLTARIWAWLFSMVIFLNRLAYLVYDLESGRPWFDQIPIHVCDIAGITTICALILRNDRCFEIGYFWGLAGTVQALITPDLAHGFPDPHFFLFFVGHGGIVSGVLFGALGLRLKIAPRSILRATLWLYVYAGVVGVVDAMLGVNYGYLCGKPGEASLLDLLGPWPFYIFVLAAIAPLFFAIFYLPYFVRDRLRE